MTEQKFSDAHEWVAIQEDIATVGISAHAQALLGEVVHLQLPQVGEEVSVEQEASMVESVKTASGFGCPVSGTVVEVNQALLADPSLINRSPEHEGWLYKVKIKEQVPEVALMSLAQYKACLDAD